MAARLRTRNRPGLILLIVLGMLSLFSLLAVTYVVFSGTARTASLQMARRDYRGTPAPRLMDQAIRQIIRGTTDTDSVAWRHSLLEDLYGSLDAPLSLRARLNQMGPTSGTYTPPTFPLPLGDPMGPQLYNSRFLKIPLDYTTDLPLHSDALTGRVLTFTSGPLSNQSFRIVRYVGQLEAGELATLDTCQFTILIDLSTVKDNRMTIGATTRSVSEWMAAEANGAALVYDIQGTTTLNKPFSLIINDGAQNGTGIGVSITPAGVVTPAPTPTYVLAKRLDPVPDLVAPFNNVPDGILPNHSFTNKMTRPPHGQTYTQTGDSDESYDAADYGNFFMALRKGAAASSDDIMPSFHRPEVINFLASLDSSSLLLSGMSTDQLISFLNLVQRATGRPVSYSIKNFPNTNDTFQLNSHFNGGSGIDITSGVRNPQLIFDWDQRNNASEQEAFDAWLRWQLRGPWDVDNDFDGIKDSVWVDLNFPLSTAPDGKLLKVLAAFYIEDMGGKLDINAAGAQIQAQSSFSLQRNNLKHAYLPNNGASPSDWPQGLGFGPADIYMRHLFNTDAQLQNVMQRRYGSSTGSNKPGADNTDDLISQLLAHQSIDQVTPPAVTRPSFPTYASLPGLPVSTHGRIGLSLDLLGNPLLLDDSTIALNEEKDDPYESYVLNEGHGDRHLGVAEWERLVRYNDPDRSSLPRELESLTSGSFSPAEIARLRSITPRSVSLSTPRFNRLLNTTTGQKRVSSFVEFVESYVQRRFAGAYPRISNRQIAELFPVEFAHNRPLDLNRPLGNGKDDNNDGQVDEPQELVLNAGGVPQNQLEPWIGGSTITGDYFGNYSENTFAFDPGNDPTDPNFQVHSGMRSRQLLARHLYCLAQLILPVNNLGQNVYIFPNQPDTTTPVGNETRARILAQWAVNVVDFRDADAAMTRFPYDPDPFRDTSNNYAPAWQPDPQHVVFGFEQPELLLTETLATHDIRVRKRPNANEWDQLRLPEGSLFLEFYCPRSTQVTMPPAPAGSDNLLPGVPAMYTRANSNSPFALNLGQTISDGTNTFPVWRVLLTRPEKDSGGNLTRDAFFQAFDGTDEQWSPAAPIAVQPTTPVTTGVHSFRYQYQIENSQAGLLWRIPNDPGINPAENTPIPTPVVDRVMWFADLQPTANNVALPNLANAVSKVYKWQGGVNQVQGGQYLVVGPRPITYFGGTVQTAPLFHKPNPHRLVLNRPDPMNAANRIWDWVQSYDGNNVPGFWIAAAPPKSQNPLPAPVPFGNMVRTCVTMIAGAQMPDDWTPLPTEITQTYVGLNISEPTPTLDLTQTPPVSEYYPVPTVRVNDTDNVGDPAVDAVGYRTLSMDGYLDASVSPPSGQKAVFDADTTAAGSSSFFLQKNGWPNNTVLPDTGTKQNWSSAVLQRLADPDRPWHAVFNPYVTVDWQSIDLTVFSGEDDATGFSNPLEVRFATRAKSGRPSKIVGNSGNYTREFHTGGSTFHAYETSFPQNVTPPSGNANAYFKHELKPEHVTGQATNTEFRNNVATFSTLGYLNRNYLIRNADPAIPQYYDNNYLGAPTPTPAAPFHPNRNFINSHELANVTLSGPGTFSQDFYFQPTPNVSSTPPLPRHRHTLDFETKLGSSVPQAIAELFELASVNSPWPDSWRVINPADVARVNPSNRQLSARNYLLGAFESPMNFVPTYREPGRVNVNSVTEDNVWRGLMGNLMPVNTRNSGGTVPFQASVNGTVAVTGNGSVLDNRTPAPAPGQAGNPNLNSGFPTMLPGVFTSITGRNVFPVNAPFTNSSDMTMYRRNTSSGNRIFDSSGILNTSNTPAMVDEANQPIKNTYIYNFPAARMSNLVTSQSHVYAVRMTLGFFEYTPGLGVGTEYGSDEGRSVRHRAFYLIDRSIPVGFQPGMDYNTDEVIVARRIIE